MHPPLVQLVPAAIALVVSGAVFGIVLRLTSGRAWASAGMSMAASVVRGIRAWVRPSDDKPGPVSVAAVEPDDPASGTGPTPTDPEAEVDEAPGPGRWTPPPAARVRGRIA